MRNIRGKDTNVERKLRLALWHLGLRYRIHVAQLPGRPDIVFPKQKVVIFVDGCFWHGCKQHCVLPRTNANFWRQKIEANINRDSHVSAELFEANWNVVRVWEHDIINDLTRVVAEIDILIRSS